VRDLASSEAAQITVPYRSSLKKFQTRWVGDLPDRITGTIKLDPEDSRLPLSGFLTNQTGKDLYDVYLAFVAPGNRDWVIYLPGWPKNQTIDIKKDLAKPLYVGSSDNGHNQFNAGPGEKKVLSDELAPPGGRNDRDFHGWQNFWYNRFRRTNSEEGARVDDSASIVLPVLSLFDRLPPSRNLAENVQKQSGGTTDRFELYRRGARMLNVSPSIMAGQLAVLASTEGPLPVPVEINGDVIGGTGTVLYQFLLPIDRGDVDKPTTQPQ